MDRKQTKIQEKIIDQSLNFFQKKNYGYLNVGMRTGKIRISIELLKKLFNGDFTRLLVCYPNNKIKESWEIDCKKWNYNNPFIDYINFSSLKKVVDNKYDFIIVDEFHETSEGERLTLLKLIENSKKSVFPAKVLLLSGTITYETKKLWINFQEIYKYTIKEGIEDGILSDYEVYIHKVELDDKIKTKNSKGKLLTEKQKYKNLTWVIENKKREGEEFMFLTLNRNRLSSSSIAKKQYVLSLLKSLKDKRVIVFCGLTKVADELGIPSYHSKSKNDDNFRDFQEGKINHLALCESGKIGVSYASLEEIILLNFTGTTENSFQAISRALLLDYPDKKARIHIICLNEKPELKKLKSTLELLDKTKITYL